MRVIKFPKEKEFRNAIKNSGFEFTVKQFKDDDPNKYFWKVKKCTYEQLEDICTKLKITKRGREGLTYSKGRIEFYLASIRSNSRGVTFTTNIVEH